MPDPDGDQAICDICRSEFPIAALEETTPDVLADESEMLTLCEACRTVYDFTPNDGRCLACGAPVESEDAGHRIDITFPVSDRPDGPIADISGSVCNDCAARIGSDLLFSGIRGQESTHGKLLEAIAQQNDGPRESNDRDETRPAGESLP